mmetsp:Transcript_886/g.1371  ORF Transcript_886/g.1371 Transcript_886/m.1371 type:complete len:607 (-) Transcript_886:213-2033(-)
MSRRLDDEEEIVFETTAPVLFSPLEKKMGVSLQWKGWKARLISIDSKARLFYRKDKRDSPISGILDLSKVTVTEMANNTKSAREESEADCEDDEVELDAEDVNEHGVVVQCRKLDGYETYFRCVMTDEVLARFKDAIRLVSADHNIDNLRRNSITSHIAQLRSTPGLGGGSSNRGGGGGIMGRFQSVMRKATVARAMDMFDVRSVKDRTLMRRGSMRCLPVLFSNDLVHGSWWFAIGSVLFVITSVMILINSFGKSLGEDDSALDGYHYRATWVLMIISGIFGTLGAMAFMRAVHEEPPFKPLFPNWYFVQNDELVGSWLFLLASLPVIPYSLIYLSTEHDNFIYLSSLAISVLLALGCTLFVVACHPSENPRRRKIIQPIAFYACLFFCSEEWMKLHLSNDWLAGCWFIYWGTLLATIACFALFLVALAKENVLLSFIYGTALVETICFLVGSAYFVAGSYPEGSLVAGTDSEFNYSPLGRAGRGGADVDVESSVSQSVDTVGFFGAGVHVPPTTAPSSSSSSSSASWALSRPVAGAAVSSSNTTNKHYTGNNSGTTATLFGTGTHSGNVKNGASHQQQQEQEQQSSLRVSLLDNDQLLAHDGTM